MNKPRILVSACLLGVNCRYSGDGQRMEGIGELMELAELVPVCPEILGGLPTPRPPAERRGARVCTRDGGDVTQAYRRGAQECVRLAELYGAQLALLKERSPSCGAGEIYDGSFSGRRVPGSGVAAEELERRGVQVYGETRAKELIEILRARTATPERGREK